KLLITIVDYRWNPLVNIPVQFETIDEYYEEYYTNKQGQILFYVNNNLNDTELIHILVGGINEKISLMDNEVTVRLSMINRNTGESYDDGTFGLVVFSSRRFRCCSTYAILSLTSFSINL
ncbi:unnamed protein product, partial [Adineta steineri]